MNNRPICQHCGDQPVYCIPEDPLMLATCSRCELDFRFNACIPYYERAENEELRWAKFSTHRDSIASAEQAFIAQHS